MPTAYYRSFRNELPSQVTEVSKPSKSSSHAHFNWAETKHWLPLSFGPHFRHNQTWALLVFWASIFTKVVDYWATVMYHLNFRWAASALGQDRENLCGLPWVYCHKDFRILCLLRNWNCVLVFERLARWRTVLTVYKVKSHFMAVLVHLTVRHTYPFKSEITCHIGSPH